MVLEDIDSIANKIRGYLQKKLGLSVEEEYFVLRYLMEDALTDVNNQLFADEGEDDDDIFDEADDELEEEPEEEYEDEEPEVVESFDEMEDKAEEFLDEPGSEMEMPLEPIPQRRAVPVAPVQKRGGGRPQKRVEDMTKRGKIKEAGGSGVPASDVIKKPKFLMREKKSQEEVDKGEY